MVDGIHSDSDSECFFFFSSSRLVLGGRGTARPGSLPRLQQAHPARAEYDTESGCAVWPRLRAAHQRGQ